MLCLDFGISKEELKEKIKLPLVSEENDKLVYKFTENYTYHYESEVIKYYYNLYNEYGLLEASMTLRQFPYSFEIGENEYMYFGRDEIIEYFDERFGVKRDYPPNEAEHVYWYDKEQKIRLKLYTNYDNDLYVLRSLIWTSPVPF